MILPLQRPMGPPTVLVISSRCTNINTTKPKTINISSFPPRPIQNPKLVLTHDVVRNTKTLHCTIYTSQQASSAREYPAALTGYAEIADINVNVEIPIEECHQVWRRQGQIKKVPLWNLRVTVLRDPYIRGNFPSRNFEFISQDTLNKAACQLEAAFSDVFDIGKRGVIPAAKRASIDDCRPENITISFATDKTIANWKQFLGILSLLEEEWTEERMSII